MATKRANGEGTTHHERERGRWVGRLYVDGKRRKVTARTKVDLLARMAELRHASATGETVADGRMTFGEVARLWRERVLDARAFAPSTSDRYRWMLDRVIAELGSRRLRTLTVEDVERALDRLATGAHRRAGREDTPITRSTLTRLRALVAEILDFAVRRRLVASNVARLAELTPSARRERRQRSLTPDEAATLWAATDGERLGPLFRLMLLTGLRPGEALGLCWDAVDLQAATITVRRAVRIDGARPTLVDELKTAASFRTIGLGERAVEVLRAQLVAQRVKRVAAPAWADDRLVFASERGTVLDPANVRRVLRTVCRRAGLPEINPNELRHSAASLMSDRGVPLEQIADALGHSGTQMLDLVYRHRVRPSADAARVLDSVIDAQVG
jgi:integrase